MPAIGYFVGFFQSIPLTLPAWPWVGDPCRDPSPSAIFQLLGSPPSGRVAPSSASLSLLTRLLRALWLSRPTPVTASLQKAPQAFSFPDFYFFPTTKHTLEWEDFFRSHRVADVLCGAPPDLRREEQPPFSGGDGSSQIFGLLLKNSHQRTADSLIASRVPHTTTPPRHFSK